MTAVKAFVKGLKEENIPDRVLATILVIEAMTDESDEDGRTRTRNITPNLQDAMIAHRARYRGIEIERLANRFTIMFDDPGRAIRCASAVRTSTQQMSLTVRGGWHTGECDVDGSKVSGAVIQLTTKIVKEASPVKLIVSNTVRDLASGPGFEFVERDESVMKTAEGEWHLFSLISNG